MTNENYLAMTEGLKALLAEVGLERYYDIFVTKGYDSENDMRYLEEHDLDCMNIEDSHDRQLLLTTALHHMPSNEHKLYEWLQSVGLDYYFVSFIQAEITDLEQISRLNLPDEKIYDELEITLPGHKRRLERAVHQLSKRRRQEADAEIPLAYGFWGRPAALTEAKFDFLCVKATVSSTSDPAKCRDLEFMVDSGSDVVTLQQDILDTLDLELLGIVRSRGVHASRRKHLYKARLCIGDQEIDIEAMSEPYNSLGSRVIRHFRHYIDGNRHIWLRGNYTESSPVEFPVVPASASQSEEEEEEESPLLPVLEAETVESQTSENESSHSTSVDLL